MAVPIVAAVNKELICKGYIEGLFGLVFVNWKTNAKRGTKVEIFIANQVIERKSSTHSEVKISTYFALVTDKKSEVGIKRHHNTWLIIVVMVVGKHNVYAGTYTHEEPIGILEPLSCRDVNEVDGRATKTFEVGHFNVAFVIEIA